MLSVQHGSVGVHAYRKDIPRVCGRSSPGWRGSAEQPQHPRWPRGITGAAHACSMPTPENQHAWHSGIGAAHALPGSRRAAAPCRSALASPKMSCARRSVCSRLQRPALRSLIAAKNWLNCSYDSRALHPPKTSSSAALSRLASCAGAYAVHVRKPSSFFTPSLPQRTWPA